MPKISSNLKVFFFSFFGQFKFQYREIQKKYKGEVVYLAWLSKNDG